MSNINIRSLVVFSTAIIMLSTVSFFAAPTNTLVARVSPNVVGQSVTPVTAKHARMFVSATMVISQVYSGGGGASGTWNRDYVELHNISTGPQLLDGLALQYGSATGNFGSAATLIFAFPAGITIPAGGYYLIQTGTTAGINVNPTVPDQTTTNLSLGGASGKIALTNTAVGLGCGLTASPCTLPDVRIIDSVAWGTSNNGEGGTTVNNGAGLVTTQSSARLYSGCTERDNNNQDFGLNNFSGAPPASTFRNSATPVFICGVSAAGVTIGGRIADASGRGIGRVMVTLSGGELAQPIRTLTSPFGYYLFDDLTVGSTYVLSVASKRHAFSPNTRLISLTDSITDVDFTAEEPASGLAPANLKR